MSSRDAFDQAWIILAEEGRCDGFGGMEYKRVRRTWEQYGRPARQLDAFIVTHANTGPDGKGRERLN